MTHSHTERAQREGKDNTRASFYESNASLLVRDRDATRLWDQEVT